MNKLKILMLTNDTTYTYNLRNELIERLAADGHEVVVASRPLLLQDELKALGCKLIDIETDRNGTNPFSDLYLLIKYRKILQKERPNIVLTYNIKPNVYGGMACRMAGVHYIPNITGLGTAVEYPGLLQKITTKLYKVGVAKADCIMFQNEENKQFFFDKKIIAKNTHTRVLPGSGVSLRMHKPLDYPKDGGITNFLFVARIMKEKGIDLYLSAAKRIYKNNKKVMFHICGYCDDEEYKAVLEAAEKEGYVKYHGEQKNMIPFFEMAHCIVHPSYYPEGMSNVLLEAAAHCRPIITTNRPGCRETVDDEKTGLIIPINDKDALENALLRFIDLPWKQKKSMGLKARKKIEAQFDRQFVVQAYLEEINSIYSIVGN